MKENEMKQLWQGEHDVPKIDFVVLLRNLDAWRSKLRKKAMIDTWIQVGSAGIIVGLALYNSKLIPLSIFCVAIVIWYVRDLRAFYNVDDTESNSSDLKRSLNLKTAKMKSYFLRTRILMYAVMPFSVPLIIYAFGSFDPPSIKIWHWTFSLVESFIGFEIISIVATEIGFALTYRPAFKEMKELLKELDSNE